MPFKQKCQRYKNRNRICLQVLKALRRLAHALHSSVLFILKQVSKHETKLLHATTLRVFPDPQQLQQCHSEAVVSTGTRCGSLPRSSKREIWQGKTRRNETSSTTIGVNDTLGQHRDWASRQSHATDFSQRHDPEAYVRQRRTIWLAARLCELRCHPMRQ